MLKAASTGTMILAVGLYGSAAHAHLFEAIKACEKSAKTMIACLVVEKGVEKIVEKSAESWWDYYYHQGGDKTPTTSPERPKIGAPPEQIRRLEQVGKRLPDLLGEITVHRKSDPTEGLESCVLREGGCRPSRGPGK